MAIDPATIPAPLLTGVLCRTVGELWHALAGLPDDLPTETVCGSALALQFIPAIPGLLPGSDWRAHLCIDDAEYTDAAPPPAFEALPPQP